VLKEIEVPQPHDLSVVHRMLSRDASITKATTRDNIHGNRELPLGGIKLAALHVTRGWGATIILSRPDILLDAYMNATRLARK
jgi:hypothetical protein